MEYVDCKLTITKANKVKYEVENRELGKDNAKPETPDSYIEGELCDDELTKLTVERFNRFVGTYTDFCQQEDLRLLGSHLYHILFGGKTKRINLFNGIVESETPTDFSLGTRFIDRYSKFEKAYESRKNQMGANEPEYRFRVILIFEEGSDRLASYPWEFLYVPRENNNGFFVAGMETGLILTRCVPPIIERRLPPGEKMKIVVAWAQARELKPVLVNDTIVEIETLAVGMEQDLKRQNIEVISLPRATHRGLQEIIEKEEPQIVHFIGHGDIKQGESKIAFMKTEEEIEEARIVLRKSGERREPDEADWVTSDSMRGLFQGSPPLLVFLHACNSAKAPDSLKTFRGVAEQVLRAKVPFVVAMQYEISNTDATDFAKTFYQNLGEGMSIEEAVKAGRNKLGKMSPAWGHPRFGTPVVYLQSENSAIVSRKPEDAHVSSPPSTQLDLTQICPYEDCEKTIDRTRKRCSCVKRQPLKHCVNLSCQKANHPEDPECSYCLTPFENESSAQTPTAAPRRLSRNQSAEQTQFAPSAPTGPATPSEKL